jgi:nitrate reductase (cytochrome)
MGPPFLQMTRRDLLRFFGAAGGLAAAGNLTGCADALARQNAISVDGWQKSVCRFCGTGCEMAVGLEKGRVVKVEGLQGGWNRGRLCVKGLMNRDILYVKDRALHPMIRHNGTLVQATWDDALDATAEGFKRAIAEGGPKAVGFYGSGQLLTQDSYTANKLFKAGIGSNNVEGNPRLCMASAVAGYISTYGQDEPMGVYDDINHATLMFITGANMMEAHPVLWEMVKDRKKVYPALEIIVVDPRRTPTARAADMHLQIRPGTDVALYNAMCYEFIRTGLVDREMIDEHLTFRKGAPTTDPLTFEDLVQFLDDYTPSKVAELCGVGAADIREAAQRFGNAEAALSLWTMGINQQTHGTAANRMINAIHLLTGQIGRPGASPFSLTGQPNAGGGVRDMGALSHSLPLGMVVANPEHRAKWEKNWGVPAGRIAPEPGYHTVRMFQAMYEGHLKAALVMCTNPGHSLPNSAKYREGMEKCFLVVADAVHPTPTSELADVVLPAAMWVEKEGVYSSAERRYHMIHKLVDPPGEAKSDLEILVALADRLGHGDLIKSRTPRDVWDEWRAFSKGSKYDFSGMTYERLEKEAGLRWPVPSEDSPETLYRFVPGKDPLAKPEGRIDFYSRPDKRAVVYLTPQNDFAEAPDEEFPFILTTGRKLEHWHTETMTGKIDELAPIRTDYLEVHPTDARKLGVKQGERVLVSSRRGEVSLWVVLSDAVRPGLVFAPMHCRKNLVNDVCIDAVDPVSFEPEFKIAAVRVERSESPSTSHRTGYRGIA